MKKEIGIEVKIPRVGTHIAWRWKSERPSPFLDGWVRQQSKNIIRIADWEYGNGSWIRVEEIEFHEIKSP